MKIKTPKDKWLPAFIVAAVVAVVAIVVAIVVGVTPQGPGTPTYVEGPETGVYYYDVVDGEVVLTFSNGHNFTIAGPLINKTGTYTVDGATITLDFFKDEDGTTTATLDGDKVALVYDNATMQFTRKINYTVNFNANGGSAVEAVTVVNGKTVSKPADPTKENAVFLGWYTDEALTTPYNFDTATIKENTTVYARWADKPAGVPEYMVSFDLGYEGAEALEAMSTIGGIAYDVPTPQRSGYTFVGWYISMYEDGQKLSYAYTAETQFTADTTLYAVWHDDSNTKLQAPAVTVTDNAITWDTVKGAASYKLTVIDPKGNVVVDNETVGATVRAFDFASAVAGEYQISVVAVAGNEENNSEPTQRYYANKALDRVSNFTVENGILIFGAVENAQKYTITIDCGNDEHIHTAFDNGNSTIYYIANCPMQEGGILVTVTASANGYASSTSKVFVYNKVLDKVEQVVYDKENDKFVWNAVAGTASYQVTVTADGKEYTFDNGTSTSFSVAGFTGDITVSVKPVTEGYNSPEATEASCKKTAPAAPDGLTAVGMIISWNPVAGATAYEVNVGGQTVTVDTNSLNLAEGTLTLTQGQTYTVKVRAINANNESSSYSESMEAGYFVMTSNLRYNRNTVSWDPVLGVNQYQVRINGGAAKIVTDANSTRVTLTKEGENLIEVRYVLGDNASDWISMTVTAYAVEYDTRSVAYGMVQVEYLAVGDEMSLPDTGFSYEGYEFSGWYNAPMGATGNGKEYAEGTVFNGSAYTVLYAAWTPKKYNVTLKTEGYDITNIENDATEVVTFSKDFTLTIPSAKDTGMYFFAGWYTGPSGTGVQVTDENGNSVRPYNVAGEMILYPYYSTNALEFILQADGTYGVKKGPAIEDVTNLTIPVTYNEIPITSILESAFSSCTKLLSVKMPDTIRLVGTSAFTSCSKLQSIEVYKAKEGVYETFYSSVDGVLLRDDMGTIYLEVVPRAMTGDYTIPDGVQKVLPKAFYYSQITTVTIPDSVTVLPQYAFYCCKNMTDVFFAPGRTNPITYEKSAFYLCDNVERVTMPAILDMDLATTAAFLNMFKGLKSVEVEAGGVNYASVAGLMTDSTKSTILYCPLNYTGDLVLPKGISGIGDEAFKNHDKITSITIPVWVTNIGKSAFEGCDGVKSITFLDSRSEDLTIGDNAFAGMLNLISISFEGNGTTEVDRGRVLMGLNAFHAYVPTSDTDAKRSRLQKVEIGAGVNIPVIGPNAFENQSRLAIFNVDPAAYIGEIAEYAFAGCSRFSTFDVPATITKIGQYAFSECIALSFLNFSEKGTTMNIGEFAFNGCTRLSSVTLPSYLEAFNSTAFTGCTSLAELKIGVDSTQYVNDANGILYRRDADTGAMAELLFYPLALVRAKNGVIDDLPETLTAIGGAAFSNNTFVVSVTIPKNVTTIGDSAFSNCTSLQTIKFSADCAAMTIQNSAFLNCTSLSSIDLPANTTAIGDSAFEGCLFAKIVIPAKVTSIGKAAFRNCVNLAEVTFNCDGGLTIGSNAATYTEGTFSGCTALKTVSLPAGITTIGKFTFYNCSGLETVNFAADAALKTIGDYAFAESGLKSIVIPKNVKTIGTYAFSVKSVYTIAKNNTVTGTGEPTLQEVTFEQFGTSALSIGANAFTNQANLKAITLPARLQKLNVAVVAANHTKAVDYRSVFAGCTALAEVNVAEDLVEGVTQYFSSLDGVLYNMDKTALLFCPIGNVGRYNENGEPTYELIIPNTVQTVFTYAFHNTQGLKTITFQEFDKENENYGKQLLTIGNYAYTSSSSSLTTGGYAYATIGGEFSSISTVNLPSHLSKINSGAFSLFDTATLVTVNINPDANNITLSKYAFRWSKVTGLNIPGTLKSMSTHVFYQAEYMATCSFNLPESVTTLPQYTFYKCTALTGFEIPAHITTLDNYAFQYCASLKSITIPEKVYKFGNYLFGYSGLESFYLPATVTSIGTYTFQRCYELKTVELGLDENGKSPITKLPAGMFNYCYILEEVINIYKLDLTEIGNSSFMYCEKITEFDFTQFPNLANLGGTAFAYSGLEVADLSKCDQLTSLSTVFQNARKLKTLLLGNNMASYTSSISMLYNYDLETVILGVNTPSTILGAFTGYAIDIVIPEGNPFMVMDEFGVIYDPNYQTIIFVSGKSKDLTGYTIPSTVTAFADSSFSGVKMDKLIIPEGVVSIGEYAFQETDIPYISFPASLEIIDNFCFGDSTLKEIVFADEHNSKLSFLGGYAFWYCPNLEKIVLPDNLALSPNYTTPFHNCSGLKSLTVGAATKQLPPTLLAGCYAMEELILQEGLEHIDTMMVAYNGSGGTHTNNVKSMYIPSTVKSIKEKAFHSFHNLETVTIGDKSQLQTAGFQLFYDCHSLKTISPLPSTLTTLGYEAFFNCYALESIDLSATLLTAIDKGTFRNTTSMATVKFPVGLLSIGNDAFYNTGLVELEIPMGLESIGNNAFENATKLKTLTFESGSIFAELGNTEEDCNIFRNTTSLETMVLPNSIRVIGKNVFENSGVKTVTLSDPTAPSGLDTIGDHAFANCTNLTSFDLLENTTKIDDAAFFMCTSLESATLSDKLDYLGTAAFGYCNSLKTAYIPANVTTMTGNPFIGLEQSKISMDPRNEYFVVKTDANGVLTITDVSETALYAVFGATGKYDVSNMNMVMSGAFTGNDITEIVLPKRVSYVGDYLFMNCQKLTSVTIEGDINRIGDYAFYNTAISNITIPDTVASIGDYAFTYCKNLSSVYIPVMDGTTIGDYCFAYCTSLADVAFGDYSPTKSAFYTLLGTHIFYECSSLTKVALPNKFKCTTADAAKYGFTTVSGVIPSYMFAGTAIVEAVLPAFVDYLYTDGIFANCKKLERIFMTDQPSGTAIQCYINKNIIEGCDNFQYFYSEFISSNYAYGLVNLDKGGFTEFYVDYLLDPAKYTEFYGASSYGAYLYQVSAEFKLYVRKQTWQEMIPYFANLYDPWVMQIFDKDGNQLVCSEDDGTVAYVLDKNGNKIWEAPEA